MLLAVAFGPGLSIGLLALLALQFTRGIPVFAALLPVRAALWVAGGLRVTRQTVLVALWLVASAGLVPIVAHVADAIGTAAVTVARHFRRYGRASFARLVAAQVTWGLVLVPVTTELTLTRLVA